MITIQKEFPYLPTTTKLSVMRRLFALSAVISFFSCGSNDNQNNQKQEEWLLTEKRRYEYRLNDVGYPDTTFVYISRYKAGVSTDSSRTFYVSRYKGDLISDKIYYRYAPDQKTVEQIYASHYEFDNTGRILSTRFEVGGKLYKSETHSYSQQKQPVRTVLIQRRGGGVLPDETTTGYSAEPATAVTGYDTIIGTYNFDSSNKVLGTAYTDTRGNLLRKDVNVYSGNDPLRSYSLGAKGDTMQRIAYEKNGKTLHTKLENDSFVMYQNMTGPLQTGQLTMFKRSNEKWKTTATFDINGRKVEEKVYKVGIAEN